MAETVHIDESSWRVEEGPRDEEVRLLREHLGSYNIRHSAIEHAHQKLYLRKRLK